MYVRQRVVGGGLNADLDTEDRCCFIIVKVESW